MRKDCLSKLRLPWRREAQYVTVTLQISIREKVLFIIDFDSVRQKTALSLACIILYSMHAILYILCWTLFSSVNIRFFQLLIHFRDETMRR